jgi:hypothetical protein
LAKSSYGSSPLWLYHKIDPAKRKKKTLELQEPKRAETSVGERDRLKRERFVAAKLIVEFAATLRIFVARPLVGYYGDFLRYRSGGGSSSDDARRGSLWREH